MEPDYWLECRPGELKCEWTDKGKYCLPEVSEAAMGVGNYFAETFNYMNIDDLDDDELYHTFVKYLLEYAERYPDKMEMVVAEFGKD